MGGGNGTTLRLLVEACPWIRGINFDLPHVVSDAQKSARIENVGGDMFDCIPKGDAVIIKVSVYSLRIKYLNHDKGIKNGPTKKDREKKYQI